MVNISSGSVLLYENVGRTNQALCEGGTDLGWEALNGEVHERKEFLVLQSGMRCDLGYVEKQTRRVTNPIFERLKKTRREPHTLSSLCQF